MVVANNSISILLAYAAGSVDKDQFLIEMKLPCGATVKDALEQASLMPWFSALLARVGADDASVLMQQPLGLFGQRVGLDTVLHPHDRLEIYRPLKIDPKQARRLAAAKRKKAQ